MLRIMTFVNIILVFVCVLLIDRATICFSNGGHFKTVIDFLNKDADVTNTQHIRRYFHQNMQEYDNYTLQWSNVQNMYNIIILKNLVH